MNWCKRSSYFSIDINNKIYIFLPQLTDQDNDANELIFKNIFDNINQKRVKQSIELCSKLNNISEDMIYYNYAMTYLIFGDTKNFLKYINDALEANNSFALCMLGEHYRNIKNYDLMMKFYIASVELGNSFAMYRLGSYHRYITNDYV